MRRAVGTPRVMTAAAKKVRPTATSNARTVRSAFGLACHSSHANIARDRERDPPDDAPAGLTHHAGHGVTSAGRFDSPCSMKPNAWRTVLRTVVAQPVPPAFYV